MKTQQFIITTILILLLSQSAWAGRATLKTVATEPYASAIVLDAATGEVIFSRNADTPVYPASTLKLMVLAVILEQIEQGTLQLADMVQVTVEAYKMGGSQVYLDPKEQFSIEDLLYALMIQSANDAAVALASHVAGSKEAFVDLMNKKAAKLGMKNTTFHSVHGLPPGKGQQVDVTTARDFGILCRYLSSKPEVFPYTSTRVRDFRNGEFVMRTHNHLLEKVEGCDGFKTGYFTKAGFSIAATAKRGGVRIIAIVMGSKNRKVRDAKAIELLAKGFARIPPGPEPELPLPATVQTSVLPEPASPQQTVAPAPQALEPETPTGSSGWGKFFMGVMFGFFLYAILDFFILKKGRRSSLQRRRFR